MHFSNYIGRKDAEACLDSNTKRITATPTALKQTPKPTLEFLKNNGIEIIPKEGKGRPRRLSMEEAVRILAIRKSKLSYYKISNLTGVPKSTAFDYCKRYSSEDISEEKIENIQIEKAKAFFASLLERDIDEEINSLAAKGLESLDIEEITDTMRRIEDIVNFNSH